MITIEIQQTDLKANKRLIKKIISHLPEYHYFHFFYEPKLIMRVRQASRKHITDYLKKRGIKYKVYAYPFGEGYGEDKKSVVYKYREAFLPLMGINSQLAIFRNKKHDLQIFERETHTMLNAFGYEWIDESIVYAWLAGGRVSLIRKYESSAWGISLLCLLIVTVMKFNLFLMKQLK